MRVEADARSCASRLHASVGSLSRRAIALLLNASMLLSLFLAHIRLSLSLSPRKFIRRPTLCCCTSTRVRRLSLVLFLMLSLFFDIIVHSLSLARSFGDCFSILPWQSFQVCYIALSRSSPEGWPFFLEANRVNTGPPGFTDSPVVIYCSPLSLCNYTSWIGKLAPKCKTERDGEIETIRSRLIRNGKIRHTQCEIIVNESSLSSNTQQKSNAPGISSSRVYNISADSNISRRQRLSREKKKHWKRISE